MVPDLLAEKQFPNVDVELGTAYMHKRTAGVHVYEEAARIDALRADLVHHGGTSSA